MQNSTWTPTRPASRGATAYHDAVVNTSWHKKNIKELIRIVRKKIKTDDVVVDFGAGTGASALYLLKDLKIKHKLLLVDNSPSWLTKAHEILNSNKNLTFYLLEKKKDRYMTLDELLGKNVVDHIVSANTVHLIPNIEETFRGIHTCLKKGGTFAFQSGNVIKKGREDGILMIDDSINQIHDIAIEIIRADSSFELYKKDLDKRIEQQYQQRKFVFPDPRSIEFYIKALKSIGFKHEKVTRKKIKVTYKDWLNFVRVKRLQAGILPEVGGKDASEKEEFDRDVLITRAALQLFKKLKAQNSLANTRSFTAEWVYVSTEK